MKPKDKRAQDIIDVEAIDESIVLCPQCGHKNRVFAGGQKEYRCGHCKSPILTPSKKDQTSKPSKEIDWKSLFIGLSISAAIIAWLWSSSGGFNPTHSPPRSLPNGMYLRQLFIGGEGQAMIENGTSEDAVVKFVKSGGFVADCSVYVSAMSSATVDEIEDGRYAVYFALGKDWNGKEFTSNKSFGMFQHVLVFKTTEQREGYSLNYYGTTYKLTLHPVAHGNAKTTPVSESEFTRH